MMRGEDSSHAQEAESAFPFFKLPAELRIMVYRCIPGLREVGFIKSPSPPLIPLLDTNMQIRGEALAVYYEENDFHLTLKVRAGQVLRELQKFVDGKENSIATCVRQIIFTIDQRSVGSLGNTLGYGVLDYLRFRFLSMEREERNPARELDRLSARKEFIERALVLGPGPMFIHALELFDAAWTLADTFPKARKWIYATNERLPVRFAYTTWAGIP